MYDDPFPLYDNIDDVIADYPEYYDDIIAEFPEYDEGYPGHNGYDLDCDDIVGPVNVGAYDPHGFDGDNDGIGCE